MARSSQRRCKDCSTDNIILKVIPKNNDISNIATELCTSCLQSRAQLQNMKEDKLPFPKLLAKIQSETAKRIHAEISNVSGLDRLNWKSYKGVSGWSTVHSNMSNYWVEQLQQL